LNLQLFWIWHAFFEGLACKLGYICDKYGLVNFTCNKVDLTCSQMAIRLAKSSDSKLQNQDLACKNEILICNEDFENYRSTGAYFACKTAGGHLQKYMEPWGFNLQTEHLTYNIYIYIQILHIHD
jgi:hypothetical protein